MRVGRTFWGFIGVIAIGFIGRLLTGSDSFLRLIYFSIGILFVGFLWASISIRGVTLTRSARDLRQQFGQVFEERFEITNHTRLIRPWVEIIDQSDLAVKAGSRVISWLGKREQRSYSTYASLSARGSFNLGPTTIKSGDPFGIFTNSKKIKANQTLLVLPYFIDLDRFVKPAGLMPGGKAQQLKTTEVTPHAAGVREYSPGDALNRIHWASSAKKQKLMVKEFDRDPQSDIWLFLDAHRNAHIKQAYSPPEQLTDQLFFLRKPHQIELPPDTFEYSVSIAASISRYYIRAGQAVGLNANNKYLIAIEPERGERQLGKILEALAYLQPDGVRDVNSHIEAYKRHIPRGSSVVIITSCVDDNLVSVVSSLALRDMYSIVVLVDQNDFGGTVKTENALALRQASNTSLVVVGRTHDLKSSIQDGFRFIPKNFTMNGAGQLSSAFWKPIN